MTPQDAKILQHLQKHGSIDPMKALVACGVYRLAARIYELRQQGFKISTQLVHTHKGQRVANYVYMGGPKDGRQH